MVNIQCNEGRNRDVTVSARNRDILPGAQSVGVKHAAGGLRAAGTIPEQAVDERDTTWFLAFPYFACETREILEFSVISADESIATVQASGRVVTVAGITPGTTTATVTARDPSGLEASQEFRIAVRYANRRPEALRTIREQVLRVGEMVEFDLAPYFFDPDGDPLEYEANVFFDEKVRVSLTGSVLSIIGLAEGRTWVTLRVSDPYQAEVLQRFLVTVEAFSRPADVVGKLPRQTLNVGDTLVADVSPFFGNPDGDVLEYEADSAKDHVTVSMSGTMVTITGVSVGRTFVVITANGSGGRVAIPISVRQFNQAPEAVNAIPPQAVTEGKTSPPVDLSHYFRDPDGDRLEYSVTTSDKSVATASVSGSDLTVRGVAEGTGSVTVKAWDPGGLEARQILPVTVWAEDGAEGTITRCRAPFGLLLFRRIRIEGTVRASRSVRDVKVQLHASGRSAGVCALGDMEAGETRPFLTRKAMFGWPRKPRCSMTVSWRDIP